LFGLCSGEERVPFLQSTENKIEALEKIKADQASTS